MAALAQDRFVFEGFLPPRGAARRRRIEAIAKEERTIVLFEAPHRLARTLGDLCDALGDRPAAVCRELTKRFEEVRRDTLGALRAAVGSGLAARGELTLVIEGRVAGLSTHSAATDARVADASALDAAIIAALARAGRGGGSVRDAVDRVAAERGGRQREIYRRALELRARRRWRPLSARHDGRRDPPGSPYTMAAFRPAARASATCRVSKVRISPRPRTSAAET